MSELITPYGNVTEISGCRGSGRTTTLMQHLGEKDFMFSPCNRTYFGNDKRFHHYGDLLHTTHFFFGRRGFKGFKVLIDDIDYFNNSGELRRVLSPIVAFKPDSDVWQRLEELKRTHPLMGFYTIMMALDKYNPCVYRVDGYTIVSDGELQTRNIVITPDDFESVMGLSRELSELRKAYLPNQRKIEVANEISSLEQKAADMLAKAKELQTGLDRMQAGIQGKSGGQVIFDEFSL